ncbi:LLM class flavin-dependent oxidoreductase [Modestobacter altitudinis]|uniref:LLM class flavin-dependent oxidoreductase n=1 Tax=Modestobacter altitudinis TaxID=2213158 RepID=UPI00110D1233|nr:LLM class flavin-dependent oxidoreductase [Modestobacter altitudinis]
MHRGLLVTTSLRLNNDLPVAEYVELVVAAEALGFDQVWVSDDLFLRSAPVMVTAAATRTSRIGLGIGIMNPYSVHPAELAMLAATLQEVSGGRFLLGLAAGAEEFLGWAGIPRPLPLTRTREAVRAVRALSRGDRPSDVPGTGEAWTPEAHLRFPLGAPAPVYVGAMSPKMLQMSGAEAEGVLPLLYPPEHFPVARDLVHAGARDAGRDPAEVDVAAAFWVAVDDDGARAERALAEKIAYYGASFSPYLLSRAGLAVEDFADIQAALSAGEPERATDLVTPAMLRLGIAGDADEVVRRCRWLQEQGATHLSFGPPLGPDPVAAVAVLGQQVLPRL